MKPTRVATESTPPTRCIPTTPPMSASGRFSMTSERIAAGTERDEEQQKDPDHDCKAAQCQDAGGLGCALELTAVLNVIAGRQRHFGADASADVLDHAPQVAAGDVGAHDDLSLHVLAGDKIRPAVPRHFGQRGQRQPRAAWRRYERPGDGLKRIACAGS